MGMKRMSPAQPSSSPSNRQAVYSDSYIAMKQESFDALVRGGATIPEKGRYIEDVFIEKNRKIRIGDYDQMKPATISSDYLRPRKDLSHFVLSNWAKQIFIAGLKPEISERIFMFGIGRMFSTYNDIGVQVGTDADVNIIVEDDLPVGAFKYLADRLRDFSETILERFGIVIEINPAFTILGEGAVLKNISDGGAGKRNSSRSFYKANAKSLYIIRDHEKIRRSVFSKVERLPDGILFEYFLGLESAKPSLMKLRMDREPLPIIADGSGECLRVRNVIGSAAFGRYCHSLFPREFFIPPPDWVFSMKYFVNRVYDYVCAMLNLGYGLPEIGFDASGGRDPDFLFVKNSHRMMLFLQELIQLNSSTFGSFSDFSYMSRTRFIRFAEIRGEKFRKDFEELIIGGDLLLQSHKVKYLELRAKVEAKARDRVIRMKSSALDALPKEFEYELVDRNESGSKICVPYAWADLGYFAFCVITSRIVKIVDDRLYPAYARSRQVVKV